MKNFRGLYLSMHEDVEAADSRDFMDAASLLLDIAQRLDGRDKDRVAEKIYAAAALFDLGLRARGKRSGRGPAA